MKQCEKMANALGDASSGSSIEPDKRRPCEFVNVTFSLLIISSKQFFEHKVYENATPQSYKSKKIECL